jgi:hypothetical protein
MTIFDMLRDRIADKKHANEVFGEERILEASDRLIDVVKQIDPDEVLFGAAALTKGEDGLTAMDILRSEYEAKYTADPSLMHGGLMSTTADRELAEGEATHAAKVLLMAAYEVADTRWYLRQASKEPTGSVPKI